MALSGENASLKELLENASSVLTACQNTSTTHQPKNGARHSKKQIKTVSKESKGAKKRRPISTNGLAMDWTDEEEEEETCDIENIPPVSQRGSEHPLLKPFYKMISFSSDSDSSPQLPCSRSKLHQQTYGEKSLCDQKHQHLTERRTKCKKREESSSEPGSTLMDSREFDAGSTQNCGKGEKVKSSRAETMQNCAGTTEDDTKPKNNSARTMQKGANNHHQITRAPLGSIKKQNTDLHGLFDVSSGSDSSSEFDATSVSVTCLMNGDASGSDSEDFGGLSDQLAQVLSISTCRRMPRKQPKRRGEDAMPGKENASLAAEGELRSLNDQRPLLKSKRKNLSKNSKKSCNGTCSPDPTCHKLHVGLGKTPAGSADESNRSGTSDFSVNDDEVLPETKEISLQVSLSANSETSPETSIGEGSVRSKTASTPEEIFDRREDSENCMSKKVTTRHSEEDSLCSVEEGMHVEVMSQHDSLHSEDISHNDGITTDFIDNEIEPTTRDFSLQVSIGSTELSDSEYDLSLPEKDPSDNRQHLPTVQNCSLQVSVSSSNATDSLLVFPGGKENGQAMSIGDGKCLPSTNSEKMRFCQGHMTSCDSDANLKKQLFPGSTLQSPVHYRGLSPSMWDSGFGEIRCSTASDKGTHKTQASFGSDTNRSEGASCIDHSVDKTDPPRLSLSPEDSSHDNHVGTGKDRKDQDLDNEWLPDLDSSSDESDLEACESVKILSATTVEQSAASARSSADDTRFFQEMKTPKVKKTVKDLPSMDVFIVNDSDVSSDDDSTLYVTAVEPKSHSFDKRSVLDSVFVTPCLPPLRRKASTTVKKSVSSRHYGLGDDVTMATGKRLLDRVRHVERPHSAGHVISQASFLRSLDQDMDNNRRHPEAARYVKHFKKVKEELTAHLFKLYNKTVFAHKLPEDMSITWNKRLIKTAGFCAYSKRVATPADRKVRIELSVKVCDAAERVRDTLIHELCHAAVWFLNGVNDGHGPHWKYWAHAACHVHPELPAIKRCHKYEITHKYTYKCTKCGYEIGRHSKSLDTKAKVCGYCHSPFALVTKSAATPRMPNKFALFVKENYGSMKRDNNTHKDVMRMLSSDFARQNSISASRGQKEL